MSEQTVDRLKLFEVFKAVALDIEFLEQSRSVGTGEPEFGFTVHEDVYSLNISAVPPKSGYKAIVLDKDEKGSLYNFSTSEARYTYETNNPEKLKKGILDTENIFDGNSESLTPEKASELIIAFTKAICQMSSVDAEYVMQRIEGEVFSSETRKQNRDLIFPRRASAAAEELILEAA